MSNDRSEAGACTRREALALLAGSAALLSGGPLQAQTAPAQPPAAAAPAAKPPAAPKKAQPAPAAAAPAIAPTSPDGRLIRAFENAPWVEGPTKAGNKPVYVLWAPWCPICHRFMQDVAAGVGAEYSFRWIGGGGRDDNQKNLIANVFKTGDFGVLKAGLLRQPLQLGSLPKTYVERVHSADLLAFALQHFKSDRSGYPTFVFFDGKSIVTSGGYSSAQSLAKLAAAMPFPSYGPRSTGYLDEPWADLGPATGRPHESSKGYTIYSQPSENAVPLNVVKEGYMFPSPTKRTIGVKNQKWVSVDSGISVGSTRYDGYIRVS